jgi:simple sugar transport system permease protein
MATATRPWTPAAEAVLLPLLALGAALLLFGLFVWLGGASPVEAW